MKKVILTLSLFSFAVTGSIAQSPSEAKSKSAPAEKIILEKGKTSTPVVQTSTESTSAMQVLWSEDFSGGIPSTWTNQGYSIDPSTGNPTPNPQVEWEYRGPSTTPSNTVGPRGASAGGLPPLASPGAANGFIIFDSDYLDNGGGNPGTGPAPAPHIGTLTTDTIDLTGSPFVEITMNANVAHFSSLYQIAVSNDGGDNYTDTVSFHQDVAINAVGPNPQKVSANISDVAGDESEVVLQLIYDGSQQLPGTQGGEGYYYWQLDDLTIQELPEYEVKFVEWKGTYDSRAPEHDIVLPSGYAKYGHVNLSQVIPMNFDSNIFNYGSSDLSNVRLAIIIDDANTGTNLDTLLSPAYNLNSQDSLGWDDLTTSSSWTPPGTGSYDIIYTIISDSIPAAAGSSAPMDTFTLTVTDLSTPNSFYSYDWNNIDNFVGTNSAGSGEVTAIGQRYNFPNPNEDTTDYVYIDAMSVRFSDDTDPTANIVISVYDTSDFEYAAGFTGGEIWEGNFQLDASSPGAWHTFSFNDTLQNGDAMPLELPAGGAYYFHFSMFANAPDGVVRIANDASFAQSGGSIILEVDGSTWYPGFTSRALESPLMRLHMAEAPAYNIGIEEISTQNGVSLYPNPSNGENVNIEIEQAGTYTLEVINLLGKVVSSEEVTINASEKLTRDYSQFGTGVFLINISNEEFNSTYKLTIE